MDDFVTKMEKLALDWKAADLEFLQDLTLPSLMKRYGLTDDMQLGDVYDRLEELNRNQPAGTDPKFDAQLDEFVIKQFPWIVADANLAVTDGDLKATDTIADFKKALRTQVKMLDMPYNPAKFHALMK